MSLPTLRASARSRIILAICFAILFFFTSSSLAFGQEAYLVSAADASLSVYNLASGNLIESIIPGLGTNAVAVGPNPRLAFVASGPSLSVIDLTIQREIKRLQNVNMLSAAPTADGKYLLIADGYNYSLDVLDLARLDFVRRVNLAPAMGYGAYNLGTVVVVGKKAYVTTAYPDYNRPAIAVVDLNTFKVRPISIPYGFVDYYYSYPLPPNAAATPDGKYLVMVEDEYPNYTYDLLLISTATDQLVTDNVMTYEPLGLAITPVNKPGSIYGYLLADDPDFNFSATVLDLNPGSQTFGQLLTSTEVVMPQFPLGFNGAAINGDGSRLVVAGFQGNKSGPQPNVVVLDTGLMLTDPSLAIVGQSTAANGALPEGLAIATVATTVPPTAPTVTSASGPITNDVQNTIHVEGTNFASGAQVRIGGMRPLPATVNSSSDLQVTVPANAPAAPGLDVIVTNPQSTSPPAQQQQSGLLAGGLTINANPAFQPHHEFASRNIVDGSVSVFDFTQRAMVNVPLAPPAYLYSLTFNQAGTDLYAPSRGYRYYPSSSLVLGIHLANDSVTPITMPQSLRPFGYTALVSSTNPATGGSVIYEWAPVSPGARDIVVNMIDSNPSSPTFNRVLNTYFGGINGQAPQIPYAGAATPDGKYVYVDYYDDGSGQYAIAIFDIVHGGPATIVSTQSLGVSGTQYDMQVAPDGISLLLNGFGANGYAGPIAVFDIGANPKNPTLVTELTGVPLNQLGGGAPFFFYSFQVVGKRLFAFDYPDGALVAFNFDRTNGNFSQLGAVHYAGSFYTYGNVYIAISPDGNLLYLGQGEDQMISVYDANKIASSQPALITNLAAFHAPSVIAVSPVAQDKKVSPSAGRALDEPVTRGRDLGSGGSEPENEVRSARTIETH